MAVCPGTPAVTDNPVGNAGITQTPNAPGDIFSTNAGDPFPVVSWPAVNEYCRLQFEVTSGNELVVPSQQWNVNWKNADTSAGTDAASNAALAAGFGVPVAGSTQVTGPATSGPVVIGTNTLTVTVVSGTVRVSMANGSLFGYLPGDPVSSAVIRYDWATPVNTLNHAFFDNGVDQTPTGIKNYQLSAAVAANFNPTLDCDPYAGKGTQDTQNAFSATVDNLPPTQFFGVAYGTTPGGPYNIFQTPIIAGDNTVGQTTNFIAPSLTPSTQYYAVTNVYDTDGNTVIQTSPECTFTTKAGNATDYLECSIPINLFSRHHVGFSTENGPWPLALSAFPGLSALEFSTSNAGPWSPATNYSNDLCTDTGLGFAFPGTAWFMGGDIGGASCMLANTPYFARLTYNKGNGQPDELLVCGPFTTAAYPDFGCAPVTNITTTSAQVNFTYGNPLAGVDLSPPCDQDTYVLHWGTTPGGPYPNTVNLPATTNQANFPLAGLTPNTTYYYTFEVTEANCEATGTYDTAGECQFTTLAAVVVSADCNPATNIQPNSATLNGTLHNATPGDLWNFEFSLVPGGPYTAIAPQGVAVGGDPEPISAPSGPLPAGSTIYFRVRLADSGNVDKVFSGECSFATPLAPAASCIVANNITDNSADLQVLIQFSNNPGWTYTIEYGTVNGGPYGSVLGPFAITTDPQGELKPTGAVLTPSTTYYWHVIVRDNLNVVQATSGQCTFATPATETTNCAPATAVTQTSATLNGTLFNITAGDQYRFRYGTVPGGPYGVTVGPFPAANGAVSQPTGAVLVANTNYYFIVEVLDAGNVVQATSGQCTFATLANPPSVTTNPASGITPTCITFNGTSQDTPAGCSYSFVYGTTPGGPYPFTTNDGVSSGASPENFSAQQCGLTSGVTYYFKAQVKCGDNPPVQGPEQSATPTTILVDPCEAPTAVTPVSATLHGTSNNVPAGYSYQFRYGTTPGGPYPNVVSAGPSSGATPDPYQANIVGLTPGTTYYYTSEVLNPALQVVAGGGECTFATVGSASPGGFVYWCGALYDSADCIFVPSADGGYYNCSFADSIDDV